MNLYKQVDHLLWIFLAIGICIQSIRLKLWEPSGPGSGLVPFIAGLLIGITGSLLFVLEWLKSSKEKPAGKLGESAKAAKQVIYLVGALCVMTYLMPIFGFFPTSFLAMTFMLRMIEPQKWLKDIIISLISCFAIYLLFSCLLGVQLPKGFFGI